MISEADKFPAIHSKISKNWTLVIKVLFSIFKVIVVIIPLMMVLMLVLTLKSREIIIEIKILIVVLTIAVTGLVVWSLIKQGQGKAGRKITQIVVDSQGIHDYSGQDLVRSLKYSELLSDPENGKYDIFIPRDQTDADYTVCFYLFDDALNTIKLQAFTLNADGVIINGNELRKHFIKGIIMFRSDLKIAPGVFDLYGLSINFNK